jgi:hypothetical protein
MFVLSGFNFSTFGFIIVAVLQNYCQMLNGDAFHFSRKLKFSFTGLAWLCEKLCSVCQDFTGNKRTQRQAVVLPLKTEAQRLVILLLFGP